MQQQLAEQIEIAVGERRVLVAEAGTGTGKTFAYLVPVLLSGRRTIISTGTKTLQDQLFRRDLPLVQAALRGHLQGNRRTALLKGRSNYLCLHRLEQSWTGGRLQDPQRLGQIASLREWAQRTTDGDLTSASVLPEDSPLWPQVTSTTDNCLGSRCPEFEDCFLVKARRQAQAADVVVVNHHLLLADMALKQEGFGEVLPGADAFVIDEAHQLPETASRFFSRSLSARMLRDLATDCLREAPEASGAMAVLQEPVAEMGEKLKQLALVFHRHLPDRGAWREVRRHAAVMEALTALAAALEQLDSALAAPAEQAATLAACRQRCQEAHGKLHRLLTLDTHPSPPELESPDDDDPPAPEQVGWFEQHRGLSLHLTPLSVAAPFSDYRGQLPAAWVFTSATLSVNQRFDHFTDLLGLDDADTFLAGSPFDYAGRARLWLPDDLPAPGSARYTETLMAAVLPLLAANQGRAFLLFTAHRALNEAARWLRLRTELPLFVQGEAPRSALLEGFREAGNGVLLGAASFWEGVDVPGRALSLVVIDKLPFAAPGDPVLEARLRAIKSRGGNPFMQLQVPQAVIALKQGAGRLIRQQADYGVLVLGDPRLRQRAYGRVFLASLPPMTPLQDEDGVEDFLRSPPLEPAA